jgi:hypothetical protein
MPVEWRLKGESCLLKESVIAMTGADRSEDEYRYLGGESLRG